MELKPRVVDRERGVVVVELEGKVYADVAPAIRAGLEREVDSGARSIVVDAARLEQIDSSGLGVFITLLKRVRAQGGGIAFVGVNADVARLLRLTKLDRFIGLHATLDQAIASFAPAPAPAPAGGGGGTVSGSASAGPRHAP